MRFLKNNSPDTLSTTPYRGRPGKTRKLIGGWFFTSVLVSGIFWMFFFLGFTPRALTHSAKSQPSSLPILFNAPEIKGLGHWINSEKINSMKELRGKVVLVDFWTYSCYNCINTFPHVQAWHEKYAKDGLVVLGIHAPEFQFERNLDNVKQAVKKHELTFPIALDNGFNLWRAYRNRYWPAFYLVDKSGVVRYKHFGEGRYRETEAAITRLLKQKAFNTMKPVP